MNIIILCCSIVNIALILVLIYTLKRQYKIMSLQTNSNAIIQEDSNEKRGEQEKKYLKIINKANDERRSRLIRHAFNRLPMSFELLKMLWDDQRTAVDNTDSAVIQRDLIIDMSNALNLYRTRCKIDEIEKADFISEDLEELSDKVLIKLRNESQTSLTNQLETMDNLIEKLKYNPNDKELIKKLEKLDQSIDKDLVEGIPTLKAKYKYCSEKLISTFTKHEKEDEIDDKTKNYNIRSIQAHRRALKKFEDFEVFEKNKYKAGECLHELVNLIGGWQGSYLLPSTMSYNNTIYGLIFSKLKKDAQFKITELMVHEKKKEL